MTGEKERGFTVLLEDVRGDVKALRDGYRQLDQKIDRVALESLDRDSALERKMDLGFATVMKEIRGMKTELQQEMQAMKTELRQDIQGIGQRLDTHLQAHAS